MPLALAHFFKKLGGGEGGPKTKKAKDILRFSRRHDLFCSLFEDSFSTKSGKRIKKNKKDQKDKRT